MTRFFKSLLILLLLGSSGQSFALEQQVFNTLISDINNKNFENPEKFLKENQKSLEKDPEYYVVLLNYVVHKADQSQLTIAQGKPREGELALADDSGKVVGFIGNRGGYNDELIIDGINKTQNALPHFNNRLDIHFGIVAIARRIKNWSILGDQLTEVIKISRKIDNNWTWGPINSMDGDPQEFMIQNILSSANTLFRANSATADKALRKISQALIEYYPKKVFGYANMGSLHAVKKEYKKAQEYYQKALEIDPDDNIVKNNLKRLRELMENN